MILDYFLQYYKRLLHLFFFCLFPFSSLYASPDIHPSTPLLGTPFTIIEGLEILRSSGCTPTFISGDAIIPEKTLVQVLTEIEEYQHVAEIAKSSKCSLTPLAQKVLKQIQKQYAPDKDTNNPPTLSLHHPSVRLHYLGFEQDGRSLPYSSITTASISPWTAYREGVPYESGHNFFTTAKGGFSLGKFFDLSAEPSLLLNASRELKPNLHTATVKTTWHNFEIKLGRSPVIWGQGRGEERLLFSGNSAPLDMVQIGSPQSFTLPWIFKHLGPFQYRVMFTVLDENQRFPYSMLLGGRVMFKPLSNLEFGMTRALIFGGKGAPDIYPFEPPAELLGFRFRSGWIFNLPIYRRDSSSEINNVFSADLRWSIPSLRNSEFYFELYNEDPFDPLDFFPEDSILRGGFWIPKLNAQGTWQALLEATHAAQIVYTHSRYISGFTYKGRIMGLDSGPANWHFHSFIAHILKQRAKIWGDISYEYFYRLPHVNIGNEKNEERIWGKMGVNVALFKRFHLGMTAGAQYIRHYNFLNENKRALLGEVSLQAQF